MTKEDMNDLGIITRQPAYGGKTESDRLRRVYEAVEDQPASDWENEGGAIAPVTQQEE